MCVNNLPRVALDSGEARIRSRPIDRKSNVLTTRPPSHTTFNCLNEKQNMSTMEFKWCDLFMQLYVTFRKEISYSARLELFYLITLLII